MNISNPKFDQKKPSKFWKKVLSGAVFFLDGVVRQYNMCYIVWNATHGENLHNKVVSMLW